MASEEKLRALDAALAQIEKQYGKGSVIKNIFDEEENRKFNCQGILNSSKRRKSKC